MKRKLDNYPLILGGALVKFSAYRNGSHWRDRVRQVAAQALNQAQLQINDIDALVVATESDILSLQVNPAAVVASDLGLNHCAAMRVEGGGASGALALRSGVMHILSGMAKRVLVVGFDDASSRLSGSDTRFLYSLSFDTDIEGFAGATAASLYALSMNCHMKKHGSTQEQMATVAVKNRANAMFNPNAHKPMRITVEDVMRSPNVSSPYKLLDCSLLSDGAAAIVLSASHAAPRTDLERVQISGSGCATDAVHLGDRAQPHRFAAKAVAAQRAYEMAGLKDTAKGIDVAEVYDAFSGAEIQAIEALGLAGEGQGGEAIMAGEFNLNGRIPINLSGGLMGQGGSPGSVGIAQAVTVSRLLTQNYHAGIQPGQTLHRGLIDAHGGIATVCVVHVLEKV